MNDHLSLKHSYFTIAGHIGLTAHSKIKDENYSRKKVARPVS